RIARTPSALKGRDKGAACRCPALSGRNWVGGTVLPQGLGPGLGCSALSGRGNRTAILRPFGREERRPGSPVDAQPIEGVQATPNWRFHPWFSSVQAGGEGCVGKPARKRNVLPKASLGPSLTPDPLSRSTGRGET